MYIYNTSHSTKYREKCMAIPTPVDRHTLDCPMNVILYWHKDAFCYQSIKKALLMPRTSAGRGMVASVLLCHSQCCRKWIINSADNNPLQFASNCYIPQPITWTFCLHQFHCSCSFSFLFSSSPNAYLLDFLCIVIGIWRFSF